MSYMLTTIDNPFDPRTQWSEWDKYDKEKGYHTCSYLARIAKTGDELTEEENSKAMDQAIDEICQLNILGIYKKIKIIE